MQEPLRNYETRPVSIASPVIYIPPGQMNNPGGYGRQYAFPRVNSTGYVEALEKLYFALSQVLLGDQICSLGYTHCLQTLFCNSRCPCKHRAPILHCRAGLLKVSSLK